MQCSLHSGIHRVMCINSSEITKSKKKEAVISRMGLCCLLYDYIHRLLRWIKKMKDDGFNRLLKKDASFYISLPLCLYVEHGIVYNNLKPLSLLSLITLYTKYNHLMCIRGFKRCISISVLWKQVSTALSKVVIFHHEKKNWHETWATRYCSVHAVLRQCIGGFWHISP